MGSGKTTVGRILGRQMGLEFIDMDVEISDRMGMSITEIFETMGEAAFRGFEAQVAGDIAGCEAVVATGGGVVLSDTNVEVMQISGPVVWLRASPEVLASRIGDGRGRPLVEGEAVGRLSEIYEIRRSLYEKAADVVIDTEGKTVTRVASEVQAWIESK